MQRTDLKIFKSERMTQQADAGGQRTGIEVENGKLNEVFGNISDIDHAQSAVDIVKVYPAVATNNTELLQDGHILINEPPLDPLVDVMIIESAAINDGSERADIVEAIESSLVASLLLRSGLSEMLPGQDQLSVVDFTNSSLANPGEQPRVTLNAGSIYCLSVEYTGNESAEWPRFQHFIKILEVNSQFIRFAPALPFPAPGRTRSINGQANCTKLRDTTSGAGVIYHGVTQLTESAAGNILAVERTKGRVTPLVTESVAREDNAPFAASEQGLLRKIITVPAVGSVYQVTINDFISLMGHISSTGNADIPFIVSYISNNQKFNDFFDESALVGTTLNFALRRLTDAGTNVTISYYSSNRYQVYNNSAAYPAGNEILLETITGTVFDNARGQRYSIETGTPSTNLMVRVVSNGDSNAILAATIDAETGELSYFNDYEDLQFSAVLESNSASGESATECFFVLPFENPQPASFYMSVSLVAGGLLSASGGSSGMVLGESVTGQINGNIVRLTFSAPVKLSTLRYRVNDLVQLIPPQSLYGINPLRLPNGGAVDLFRTFGVICIAQNQFAQYPSLTAAQTISRRPNSFIDIVDAEGASLWHPLQQHYEYDKDTGEVTIVDVAGFTAPFELIDTLSELALVTAVESNQLKIASPLVGSYPAGSIVSSVCQLGDMQARVSNLFDQEVWNGTFTDTLQGNPATASYNGIDHPIEVVNDSAINERWSIQFLGSNSSFRCVGENVGQVAAGDILNDFAPINPNTGQPYFVIRATGWGGGWQPGNVVRFNTVAAAKPTVLLRSVSAGHSAIEQDSIRLHFRGNSQ